MIGVWSTTDRPSLKVQGADGSQKYKGKYVQVSRLGNPLVNEVVIPVGLKDAFNALKPQDDASVTPAVNAVLDPEVPKLIEAIYGIPAPATPRDDLFSVFLTGSRDSTSRWARSSRPRCCGSTPSIPPTDRPEPSRRARRRQRGIPERPSADRRRRRHRPPGDWRELFARARSIPALDDGVNANDVAFRDALPVRRAAALGIRHRAATMLRGSGPSRLSGGSGERRRVEPRPRPARADRRCARPRIRRARRHLDAARSHPASLRPITRQLRRRAGDLEPADAASNLRPRPRSAWKRLPEDTIHASHREQPGSQPSRWPSPSRCSSSAAVAVTRGSSGSTASAGRSPTETLAGELANPGDLSSTISALQARLHRLPTDAGSWAALGSAYIQQARVTGDPSLLREGRGLAASLARRAAGPQRAGAHRAQAALAAGRHRVRPCSRARASVTGNQSLRRRSTKASSSTPLSSWVGIRRRRTRVSGCSTSSPRCPRTRARRTSSSCAATSAGAQFAMRKRARDRLLGRRPRLRAVPARRARLELRRRRAVPAATTKTGLDAGPVVRAAALWQGQG